MVFDGNAEQDIRGLKIDKVAKGFADQMLVMKRFCTIAKTKNRQIRWYKRQTGFLDSTDTTGITASQIINTSFKARPVVVEETWERQTTNIQKFFVESPLISMEDIKDTDINILATNIKSLVRAVMNQVDTHIWDTITDASGIGTAVSVQDGWDDEATGNPILDILNGLQTIQASNYDTSSAVIIMNSIENKNLLNFLINVKGSSIPSFATDKLKSGVMMNLLGADVIVNETATTDEVLIMIPKVAVQYAQFMPITSVSMVEPGIGTKIRVWEEGVAYVTDPAAIYVITDTVT